MEPYKLNHLTRPKGDTTARRRLPLSDLRRGGLPPGSWFAFSEALDSPGKGIERPQVKQNKLRDAIHNRKQKKTPVSFWVCLKQGKKTRRC